jgi:hypothetical protein
MAALPTQRGYDEQSVTQLAVFLSNRVGELREVLRKLHAAQVVVHALSIDESVDYAVLRVVADKVEASKQALRAAGFAVSESTLLAVELPDESTGMLTVCQSLISAEINIHYAYPMFTRPHGRGVVVMHVDSFQTAAEVLKKSGMTLLDERDLVVA